MNESINTVITMLGEVKQNKEIFKEVIKEIISLADEFTPEIDGQIKRLQDYTVDMKIRMIKKFIENGFTREEAILLSTDIATSFKSAMKSANMNKQK